MSLLILPDSPLPPWARFGRYGEAGSFGLQMDGSGTSNRNYLMQRELIAATSDVTFQVRVRMTSSLETYNPAYEGLGVRLRGFQLEGSAPADSDRQVWEYNPTSHGKKAWVSDTFNEFTTMNFMINIPPDEGIDYVTVELVIRAYSGQVNIDNVECRHYYGKLEELNALGSALYTEGFSNELFAPEINGTTQPVRRIVRYLFTEAVVIRKGQNIITNIKGFMNGRAYQWLDADLISSERIPSLVGVVLKYRRKGTGTYDYMDAGGGYTSSGNKTVSINETRQRRAPYDYDQVEFIIFNEPDYEGSNATFGWGVDRLGYKDLELDLVIADFIAPTQ